MVQTGRLEKFLKMVIQLLRLVLEIVFGGRDILLVRAVCILAVIVATGHECHPSWVPLLPLLAALITFLGDFASGFRWCYSAAIEDHFLLTQNKDGPDHILSRGVPCGDIM
jgi:hypothetical protein